MTPAQITRQGTIAPAYIAGGYTQGYVILPGMALSFYARTGASHRVAKINYTVSQPCALASFPKVATNFALCVRYLTSGIETRKILWETDNSVLFDSDYAGEILPVNFALELWADPSENSLNISAQRIFLSERNTVYNGAIVTLTPIISTPITFTEAEYGT